LGMNRGITRIRCHPPQRYMYNSVVFWSVATSYG